jgi:zinc/manganese transport system substrate-binding protein
MRSLVFVLLMLALSIGPAAAAIKVAATNSDLAALTREIGGELIEVSSLVPAQMEPHAMPMRPSLIQKVREARLLITIGLDHEPWLFDVVTSAGNGRTVQGGAGYVDVSRGIQLLQVPGGAVDRSRGDLHIFGNTHYWLDPRNGKIIAVNILQALQKELPEHREALRGRCRALLADIDRRLPEWKKRLSPYQATPVVSYHLTWAYLEAFAGFQVVGTIEIKPGIEPSPAHLARLRDLMRREKVGHIIMEPYYNRQRAGALASDTGARLTVIPPSTPDGKKYVDHIDAVVGQLESAFSAGPGAVAKTR